MGSRNPVVSRPHHLQVQRGVRESRQKGGTVLRGRHQRDLLSRRQDEAAFHFQTTRIKHVLVTKSVCSARAFPCTAPLLLEYEYSRLGRASTREATGSRRYDAIL